MQYTLEWKVYDMFTGRPLASALKAEPLCKAKGVFTHTNIKAKWNERAEGILAQARAADILAT